MPYKIMLKMKNAEQYKDNNKYIGLIKTPSKKWQVISTTGSFLNKSAKKKQFKTKKEAKNYMKSSFKIK